MDQLENAVALSAVFCQDPRYQGFYDGLPHSWNGFTGIWSYLARVAKVFCEVEAECGEGVWDERDWIRCIDQTGELLYAYGYESIPDLKEEIELIFDDDE